MASRIRSGPPVGNAAHFGGNGFLERSSASSGALPRGVSPPEAAALPVPSDLGDVNTADVVDRRELSLADISHMRLDGCRTHRRLSLGGSSLSRVGPPSCPSPATQQTASRQMPPSPHLDQPQRLASIARQQRCDSPGSRMETSLRILERMALDTAVATHRQSTSGSGNGPHFSHHAFSSFSLNRSGPPSSRGSVANAGVENAAASLYPMTAADPAPEFLFGGPFARAHLREGTGEPAFSCAVADERPAAAKGGEHEGHFAALARRERLVSLGRADPPVTALNCTMLHGNSGPTGSTRPAQMAFGRTTMNDDSLDNVTAATTGNGTSFSSTVEGRDRKSKESKLDTPASVSAIEDAPGLPQIFSVSPMHRPHANADTAEAGPMSWARSSGSYGASRVCRSEDDPSQLTANAATVGPAKSGGCRSPPRPSTSALSASELTITRQIALQRRWSQCTPPHGSSKGTSSAGTTDCRGFERDEARGTAARASRDGALEVFLHRSNHDLQKILSREDKEALTISIQPFEEVDEDAEVDPLDTTARARRRLQGAVAGEGVAAPHSARESPRLPRGEGDGMTMAGGNSSSNAAPLPPSALARRASGKEETDSPTTVQPFQTWRFPLLGRSDSLLRSPQIDTGVGAFRRASQTSSSAFPSVSDAKRRRSSGAANENPAAAGRSGATRSSPRSTAASDIPTAADSQHSHGHGPTAAGRKPRDAWVEDCFAVHRPRDSENPFASSRTETQQCGSMGSRLTVTVSTSPTGTCSEPSSEKPQGVPASAPLLTSPAAPSLAPNLPSWVGSATAMASSSAAALLSANAANTEYMRRFEMVYAAYAKYQGRADGISGSSGATTLISPSSSTAATNSTTGVAGRRISFSATGQHSWFDVPHTQAPPQQGRRVSAYQSLHSPQTGLSIAGVSFNQQSSVITPGMSVSGGLGRSAGYYSFGNRLSLHHPNRQPILCTPHELQSFGHVDAALRGRSGESPTAEVTSARSPLYGHSLPELQQARRRAMDAAVAEAIARRPLLQSTIFLYFNQARLQERHERRCRAQSRSPAAAARDDGSAVPLAEAAPAVAESSGKEGARGQGSRSADSTDTAPSHRESDEGRVPRSGIARHRDCSASVVRRLDGSTSQVSFALPSLLRRGSALGASRASVAGASAVARDSRSSHDIAAGRPQLTASMSVLPVEGKALHPSRRCSGRGVASADMGALDAAAAAAARGDAGPPSQSCGGPCDFVDTDTMQENDEAEDGGTAYAAPPPPLCYRRALTPFNQLVRHVHSIDGYEREVDNESSDLVVYAGMRLMGWLEVVSLLGRGSFGQVFLCKDLRISDGRFVHPREIEGDDFTYWNCSHAYLPFSDCDTPPTHAPLVAVKVVKSVPLYEQQSVLEAEMLVLIGAQTAKDGTSTTATASTPGAACPDQATSTAGSTTSTGGSAPYFAPDPPPPDPRCENVAKILADGTCFGHHCIVMERYGANVYEFIESNNHSGLPMYQIRSIGRQLLSALTLLHEECHIIHADIKPENMLLTMDSCRSAVSTNHLHLSAPASVASTALTPQYQPKQQHRPHDAHESEPPRQQARRENPSALGGSDDLLGRSYIRLSGGSAGEAAGGGKTAVLVNAALDASFSVVAGAGQSYRQLPRNRSGQSPSVSITNSPAAAVIAPEPQRVHALNQPRPAGEARADGLAGSRAKTPNSPLDGVAFPSPTGTAPAVSRLRIKLIDFSSSCYDGGPFYTYIQSRYYRAPEVLVQSNYGSPIDMWSTGCVLAELFLGMPLLPGQNDHHQLSLIQQMLGPLPPSLLDNGAATKLYYDRRDAGGARGGEEAAAAAAATSPYVLISKEEFFQRNAMPPVPYTKYFNFETLQELTRNCPLAVEERRMSNGEPPYPPALARAVAPSGSNTGLSMTVRSELMKQRFYLLDLLRQLLNPDPLSRPTAATALVHPFFSMTPTYIQHFALE